MFTTRRRSPSTLIFPLLILLLSSLACDRPDIFIKDLYRTLTTTRITASIEEPENKSTFKFGETINFRGRYKGEHGCDTTYWTSNLDGDLLENRTNRMGCILSFDTAELSPGKHTIELVVLDDFDSTETQITITILPEGAEEKKTLSLTVMSSQPDTIDELFGNRVASRLKGECPAVPADRDWAIPENGICQWPVYYDIDSFTLDVILSEDSSGSIVKIDLTGSLNLQQLYGVGESGYGKITAGGYLEGLQITEKSPGVFLIEGTIPLTISADGNYVIFYISDGFSVIENGGFTTTIDTLVKIDTALRRFEVRYEEYPLDIPTLHGDGNLIEALTVDLALYWAEGQLSESNK